jgi:hypothetical protein
MATAQFNGFRSEDDDVTSAAKMAQLSEAYLAKAAISPTTLRSKSCAIISTRMSTNVRALEAAKAAAEPSHLDALLAFARRAYRRPLTKDESDDLIGFYHSLRDQHLGHEEAVRDSVTSVLMSPHFCYRVDPFNR